MADKGGLDYTIRVEDQFSKSLSGFESALGKSKAAIQEMNTSLAAMGATAAPLKQAANAIKGLGNPSSTKRIEQAAKNVRLLAGDLGILSRGSQGVLDLGIALRGVAAATRGIGSGRALDGFTRNMGKFLTTINTSTVNQAVQSINSLTASLSRFRQVAGAVVPQIQALTAGLMGAAQGARQAGNSVRQATAGVATAINRQNAALNTGAAATQNAAAANSVLSGSIGRLVTAFVAFRTIQFFTSGFSNLVQTGIQFNDVTEQARLSLAAIFTSAGQVEDEQGRLLKGAEAFAAAQGVAAGQIEKLKKDALETTATFEDLLTAFRQGLAPGLAAGLNVDEIREVTLLISQAAGVIGVQSNQLAEEIRSIISGTGQIRTTRVLALFPNFNQEAKQAREAGRLFEFLQEKFGSFAILGSEVANTFSARLSRVKDAIAAVVGAGAVPFFEAVKSLLKQIGDELLTINVDTIEPKPEAVAAFRGIADGLKAVVTEVQRIIASLRADDVAAIGVLISEAFGLAAEVIGPILEGTIRLVNTLATVLVPVIQGVRQLATQLQEVFTAIPAIAVAFGVVAAAAASSSTAVSVGFGGLAALFTAVEAGIYKVAVGLRNTVLPVIVLAGALGALQLAFSEIAGVRLSLFDTIKAVGLSFEITGYQVRLAWLAVKQFFAEMTGSTAEKTAALEAIEFDAQRARENLQLVKNDLAALSTDKPAGEEPVLIFQDPKPAIEKFASDLMVAAEKARLGIQSELNKTTVNPRIEPPEVDLDLERRILIAKNEGEIQRRTNEARDKGLQSLEEQIRLEGELDAMLFEEQVLRARILKEQQDGSEETKLHEAKLATLLQRQKEITAEIRKQQEIVDSPITAGVKEAFAGFRDTAQLTFQTTVDLLRGTVTAFSSFVSQSIVDAFDPNSDTTLLERFAQFLQQIAGMILDVLLQIAIAKSVIEAIDIIGGGIGSLPGVASSGTAAGNAVGGSFEGFGSFGIAAHGGRVPQYVNRPAQRFEEGGVVPGGVFASVSAHPLHPSDTVPALLTPNEHVMRTKATELYGHDFFRMLNAMRFDPLAIRSLMEGAPMPSVMDSPGPHFASGGPVSRVPSGSMASGDARPITAVVAPSFQNMENLFRGGGRQAVLNDMKENQAAYRAAQGIA